MTMARWMRWTVVGVILYLGALGWWIARPLTDTLPLFGAAGTEQEGQLLLTERNVQIGAEYDCGPLWTSEPGVLVDQAVPGQVGRVPCELPRRQQRQLVVVNVVVLTAATVAAGVVARRARRSAESDPIVRSSTR
jgi:hypothetical protein